MRVCMNFNALKITHIRQINVSSEMSEKCLRDNTKLHHTMFVKSKKKLQNASYFMSKCIVFKQNGQYFWNQHLEMSKKQEFDFIQ